MHMADALLSPVVGGAFWIVSGALIGYSAKKIAQEGDHSRTPLMGVLGAFIFAAQMINFTIPGTGSSGHLGGGLLLSILLGPYRAFITLASVLVIQCMFFADGGILALGCNIFNLAFFPAFITYPLIYKKIAGESLLQTRILGGSIAAALIGLLAGASSVIFQTVISGVSDLPFQTFMMFMLPIHAGIGVVEGLVTFSVVFFIVKASPGMLKTRLAVKSDKKVLVIFVVASIVTAGVLSQFASSHPDGLEWSIEKTSSSGAFAGKFSQLVHGTLQTVQEKVAFLPDYSFKPDALNGDTKKLAATSVAGVTGCSIFLIVTIATALIVRSKIQKAR
ncbi:MAG: energy-coupling factor ABC transporter permease [Fibrobacterota bacterium]|nr:energy-coupling factor ABC transporter permease [Chitinispirillaceae bacterium]